METGAVLVVAMTVLHVTMIEVNVLLVALLVVLLVDNLVKAIGFAQAAQIKILLGVTNVIDAKNLKEMKEVPDQEAEDLSAEASKIVTTVREIEAVVSIEVLRCVDSEEVIVRVEIVKDHIK